MDSAPKYIDPKAVRSLRQYSRKEQMMRVLWGCGYLLFRMIPRPFHGLRCSCLRLFGAKIGRNCCIASSAHVFYPWKLKMGDDCAIGDYAFIYNLGEVVLGDRVIISHKAHICAGTHDLDRMDFPLLKLPIYLESESWICADAFVGPGVSIGFGSIVGAGSVVIHNVGSEVIVAGNPVRHVRMRNRET